MSNHNDRRFTCQLCWLMTLLFACLSSALLGLPMPLIAQTVGDASVGDANASVPIRLHPENSHYFSWRGKPTILVTSGEHYGSLLNLDFDFVPYFQTLAADRLNHTRIFSGVYREIPASFGITDNSLAPKRGKYIGPWARSDQGGESDGLNKFDLKRWDEAYFARLKKYMNEARKHGIVVEMTLFCPMYDDGLWAACPMNSKNNIQGIGNVGREEVYTLKDADLLEIQRAVTVKIVTELQEFDNLYYEVCNEPYFGGVTQAWQDNIADLIAQTEANFKHQHLISMNIANGTAKVTSPHPKVSILNFHYCVPPQAVADNYQLDRVIGENETGFRGKADVLYRTEAWDFLLAGGGLFNNLDYSFTPGHPTGDLLDYQSPGGGSPSFRKQVSILKKFLESFSFVRMAPDDMVVEGLTGGLVGRALSEPGVQYAIYCHVPIDNEKSATGEYDKVSPATTVTLALPAGKYVAQWLDTKSGMASAEQRIESSGGSSELTSPQFVADIALSVRRVQE